MKLRIKGNSIRIRLLRSELDQFAAAGQISDTIEFGPSGSSFLRYSVVVSPKDENVSAAFRGNEISILVPTQIAEIWTTTEQVGFGAEQPIADGEALSILVEKDFVCLDRPDDPDRADAFPNPNESC